MRDGHWIAASLEVLTNDLRVVDVVIDDEDRGERCVGHVTSPEMGSSAAPPYRLKGGGVHVNASPKPLALRRARSEPPKKKLPRSASSRVTSKLAPTSKSIPSSELVPEQLPQKSSDTRGWTYGVSAIPS